MLSFFAFSSLSLTEPGRLYKKLQDDDFPLFDQLVDHVSSSTFKQRYQILVPPYADNKTIILYVGGESDTFRARGINDQLKVYIDAFNATFFQLEHRYYGESFPTPTLDTDSLKKYLTVDLALKDLQYFKQQISTQYGFPADAKWLIVGGSYPGLLSAYARAAFPEDFAAAISSSGVVRATNNYTEFDQQIAISLGEECAGVARQVRRRVDQLMQNTDDQTWLFKMFNVTGLNPASNFYFVLGEMFSLGPQYGSRAPLCGPLQDTLTTGKDPLTVLAKYAREVFPSYADNDVVRTYSDDALKIETAPNGPRAWLFQTCNELAYWQVNSGRLTIRSPQVTQDYFLAQCNNVFQITQMPDTDAFNKKYLQTVKNTSKIYFTTGSQDPWTPTCITEDDEISSDSVAHTIVGPEVGHCSDLSSGTATDPEDLVRTRADILAHLQQWLA